jgi:hypothetical protein
LEKAGQDIGHFLKEVVNFKLACDLPASKPAELAVSYRVQCGSQFSTYRNDIDVCNNAGGVSLLAAATAGAALNPTPAEAATFALAKIAFELCQKACRSQKSVDSCVAEVDTAARGGAIRAANAASQNNQDVERLSLFSCVDDAYAGEKLLAMDKLLAACREKANCNTDDPAFAKEFENQTNANNAAIDGRREKALSSIKAGNPKDLEYGPFIASGQVKAISLTPGDKDTTKVCRVRRPDIAARILAGPGAPSNVRVLWKQGGTTVFETALALDPANGTGSSAADMANRLQGPWRAEFQSADGKLLGSFGFLYRPEVP